MKTLVMAAALLAFLCTSLRAQPLTPPDLTSLDRTPPARRPQTPLTPPTLTPLAPMPASPFPAHLQGAFDVLTAFYPKLDSKKVARSPADSAWLLRSSQGGSGTVEVAFQGPDVVYMIFRRGIGGTPWTVAEVAHLHRAFSSALLKERVLGQLFRRSLGSSTNAAYICRKDFDVATLSSGL